VKVLIAEDEAAFRHLLQEMLDNWGYEVLVARDGNEAWQALRAAEAPRLAILDWRMPGLEGVEICRRLRQAAPEPYTYIILLTSLGREENLVAGMEAGADDYLIKPLKAGELRVRLNAGRRLVELEDDLITARNALAGRADELEEANLDLEEANRDLEAFSYAVSGDLLKSLQAINSHAQAIKAKPYCQKDQQCSAHTRHIYNRTRNLGELIGIMHDFFRPTRVVLHREPLNLSAMARLTAAKIQAKYPERRVTFRIAEGAAVDGDRNLLQTVLDNLLTNAWQHTAKREEAVIEFGVAEVGGTPACFVRDNGMGFDMAQAEKIFAPFHHLPGTEEIGGPGIGLATVERIVRRHGGRVWAEGESGKGATFYFTVSGGSRAGAKGEEAAGETL
jgi:DNA-binding response OmpR family regulator